MAPSFSQWPTGVYGAAEAHSDEVIREHAAPRRPGRTDGRDMLLLASCTSSPESALTTSASVTASAWVKPLESNSGSASSTGDTTEDSQSAADRSTEGSSVPITSPDGSAIVSEMPLPAGLTPQESDQARAALAAFRAYWALTDDLAADPTRDWSTEISGTATGAAANFLQQSIDQLREGGWKGVGRTNVRVTVTRVEAGSVDLATCVDVSTHDFVNEQGTSYKTQKDLSALAQFRGDGRVGQYESGWKVDSYSSYPATPC